MLCTVACQESCGEIMFFSSPKSTKSYLQLGFTNSFWPHSENVLNELTGLNDIVSTHCPIQTQRVEFEMCSMVRFKSVDKVSTSVYYDMDI